MNRAELQQYNRFHIRQKGPKTNTKEDFQTVREIDQPKLENLSDVEKLVKKRRKLNSKRLPLATNEQSKPSAEKRSIATALAEYKGKVLLPNGKELKLSDKTRAWLDQK